jgi:hypothetical protein
VTAHDQSDALDSSQVLLMVIVVHRRWIIVDVDVSTLDEDGGWLEVPSNPSRRS